MIPNANPIQKPRGAKLNWTCWLRKQNMEGVYVKISHIFNAVQSFDSVFFFFHSGRNCAWWFIEPLCITSFLHFRSLFNWRPANKTSRYSPPLRPLNLTAQSAKRFEYKTTTKKKQASSLVFFPFSSLPVLLIAHSSFLLSTCLSCCGLVWILWIPSPLQCIRLETPQMPALGKLQKKQKKTRESDGMKMSVMANKTLSHSYNISVTDYQTGDSKAHTFRHTQTTGG